MPKKAITILIIIVVLVGFLATFYLLGLFQFGNEPVIDDFSVKSTDESAELIIPKGALPDNVNQDDISVTRISNTASEDESWIDYKLEPDGLEFTEEILLKVQLDNDNDTFPLVLISNGNGIDLVDNILTEVDLENNTKIVSIPLTHFSTISIGFGGAFELKLSAQDTMVGEKVNTTASFTLFNTKFFRNEIKIGKGITVFEFLEPHIIYNGAWTIYEDTILSPDTTISGKPSSTQVNVGQTNTVQDDFYKVEEEGIGRLWYEAEVTASFNKFTYNSEEDYLKGLGTRQGPFRNKKSMIINAVSFRCFTPTLSLQLSFNYNDSRVETDIFVDIDGPPNTTGIVTLTGLDIEPMIQPVIIGGTGHTRNTFTFFAQGQYTAKVEIGEFTAEKQITV